MKEIELYDIITLDNNEEYTLIKLLNKNEKTYFLLAPVDEEEEPDLENVKIMEKKLENNETILEEIEDSELLKKLSYEFLEKLREEGV